MASSASGDRGAHQTVAIDRNGVPSLSLPGRRAVGQEGAMPFGLLVKVISRVESERPVQQVRRWLVRYNVLDHPRCITENRYFWSHVVHGFVLLS